MASLRLQFTALAIILLASMAGTGPAQAPTDQKFVPVAPAKAVMQVLLGNFDIVEHWLDDKDFASAGQATQTATLLATFLVRHQPEAHKVDVERFMSECRILGEKIRSKDAAGAKTVLGTMRRELAALAEKKSEADAGSWANFKPAGTTRGWMLLMDGGYADARWNRKPDEFEALAATVAEEANIIAYLRSDARWRKMAFAVRDAALAAAKDSKQDLNQARQTLRTAYPHCEECHRAYQR